MLKFFQKHKYTFLIILVAFLLMLVYQFIWISPNSLGGNDSYSYLAKAQLLRTLGLGAASYPSLLPFTFWAVIKTDNTLIFDYLVAGLLYIGTSIAFFKIVISILFACSSVVFYKVASQKVRYSLPVFIFILVCIFGNIAFFLKFAELRPLIFSIVLYFLTLSILFLYNNKNLFLIPIAFAYTLLHTTVFLTFVPVVALAIFDHKNWKSYLQSLLYLFIGITLAVLIYPAPNFIEILAIQPIIPFIYRTIPFKIDGAFEVAGDITNPGYLLASNVINILMLASAILLYGLHLSKKFRFKMDRFKLTSFSLFGLFFCLDLFSRRFSDYLTPTMIVFGLLHFDDFAKLAKLTWPFILKHKYALISVALVLFIGFSFVFYNKYLKDNFTNTDYQGNEKSDLPDPYGPAAYIDSNIAKDSYIYNDAWEDFPFFAYYAPNYKYAAGMELGFMYLYDHSMLHFYQDFRADNGFKDTGSDLIYTLCNISFKDYIHSNFKSNLLVIKKGNSEKMSKFLLDNYSRFGLKKVFENDFYTLYQF